MRILKKIKRAVTAKLLTAIAAVGLFSPVPAHASDITDKDGASLIKNGDKVHNLYAQDIDNNLAISRYGKFKLSQNEIANLFFNRQGESVFADTLVNFVDNKIDINGTVNAIRNGAIDGNLYFLTPEGIAVGTSGVINAGSVNLHSIDYSTWFALDNASVADIGNQLADLNKHIGSGTIDVKGVVNARHNINLAAQTVKVAGSLNQSPSLDFKDYVNAGSTVNNISNLKMTVDGNGDILIDDAISIHAYAKSDTSELLDLDTSDPTAALFALWRHIGSSSADVNITGSLNAAGNIDITADSTIKFAEGQHYNLLSSVKTFAEKIPVAASFIKKLENYDLSASVVSQRNSAGITVGKNAKLNAGNNINLDAKSTVTFDYNTTVANKKFYFFC